MVKNQDTGLIRSDEAYSKTMVMQRLGISQKFWDKMLAEGLPYSHVGHARWVTGAELIQHLEKHSTTKMNGAS
jgi:hypothetical protein